MTPREIALKERLTPEFLETLAEAVRVIGWGVDMHESKDLVVECYDLAGLPSPSLESLEPYENS